MTKKELRQLWGNGSTGLDLSPGDPLSLKAYYEIRTLRKQLKEAEKYKLTTKEWNKKYD